MIYAWNTRNFISYHDVEDGFRCLDNGAKLASSCVEVGKIVSECSMFLADDLFLFQDEKFENCE